VTPRRHGAGAYRSLDTTGTRPPGPGGGRVEGRRAYLGRIVPPPPPQEAVPSIPTVKRTHLQARCI
jgi:hypothetical protein